MTTNLIAREYGELAPLLFGFFYRSLENPAHSEELTQQCFLILLERRGTWANKAAIKSFLFRTAYNLIREQRRSHAQMPESSLETFPSDPQYQTENNDTVLAVRRALAMLPVESRSCLILREYQGFKYAEIAQILNLPVGTVRSRLFRAREQLAQVLTTNGGVLS